MPRDPIVSACVLIIGNEILSGRTQDVNLAHIANALNEHGVQVREARVIADLEEEIVATLNESRKKFDYVFTTGGIGPTHDDITADCVAKAFGVPLYVHPEIEALIRQREAPAEPTRPPPPALLPTPAPPLRATVRTAPALYIARPTQTQHSRPSRPWKPAEKNRCSETLDA